MTGQVIEYQTQYIDILDKDTNNIQLPEVTGNLHEDREREIEGENDKTQE